MKKVLLRTICSISLLAVLLSTITINAKPTEFATGNGNIVIKDKTTSVATFKKSLKDFNTENGFKKPFKTNLLPTLSNHQTRTYNFDQSQLVRNLSIPAIAYNITIYAKGASGGDFSSNFGGLGAFFKGAYNTSYAGNNLTIIVGQMGTSGNSGSGGGGGSFVYLTGTNAGGFPIIAAGGGGGAGSLAIDPATELIYPLAKIDANLNIDGYYGLNSGVLTGGDLGLGGKAGGNSPDYITGLITAIAPGAGGGAGWIPADHSVDNLGFYNIAQLNGTYHGSSINDPSGAIGANTGFAGSGGYGGAGANNAYGGGGGGGYSGGGGGSFDGNADGTHGGGGGSYFNTSLGTNVNSGLGAQSTQGQVVIEWDEPASCTTPTITGITGNQTICSGATTILTATADISAIFKWFSVPTGGTPLSTGPA